MQNEQNRKPSKPAARTGRRKNQPEHSQTVIIPQLSPEVLERARRAAAEGKTPQQIDEEAAAAARQAAQAQSTAEQAVEPKPQPKPQAKARKTRAEAEAELAQSIHDDHLWLNNPVMVRGLGLAPIVAMASDGDRALMLCVLSILLLTATRMLAVAVCHITGNRFRPVVYAYSAAILYIPVYIIMYNIFGTNLSIMGIYLPMMVVEPVIVKRMEAAELETIGEAFRKGINNTIGLCIAILLVGTLRELLAYGTVFEKPLLSVELLPLAAQPAGGFLLLGLLAAGWTAVGGAYVHYKQEEVRHLYADRKQ